MQLAGHELDTSIDIKDLHQQRRKGYDLGDLRNEKLQLIALDPCAALEGADRIYRKRLQAIGIADLEALLEQPNEQLLQLVEEFRQSLTVFFPAMEAMLREVASAIEELSENNPPASGQASGKLPESSRSSPGS